MRYKAFGAASSPTGEYVTYLEHIAQLAELLDRVNGIMVRSNTGLHFDRSQWLPDKDASLGVDQVTGRQL
jgi:hypothetical protein